MTHDTTTSDMGGHVQVLEDAEGDTESTEPEAPSARVRVGQLVRVTVCHLANGQPTVTHGIAVAVDPARQTVEVALLGPTTHPMHLDPTVVGRADAPVVEPVEGT